MSAAVDYAARLAGRPAGKAGHAEALPIAVIGQGERRLKNLCFVN